MLEDDHSDYSKTVHFHNRLMDLDIKCDVDSEDYAQLQVQIVVTVTQQQ